MGTLSDFRVFSSSPLAERCRNAVKCGETSEVGVKMISMLFKTNIYAVVLRELPTKVGNYTRFECSF